MAVRGLGQFRPRDVLGKLPWQHNSVCVSAFPVEFQAKAIYSPRPGAASSPSLTPQISQVIHLRKLREARAAEAASSTWEAKERESCPRRGPFPAQSSASDSEVSSCRTELPRPLPRSWVRGSRGCHIQPHRPSTPSRPFPPQAGPCSTWQPAPMQTLSLPAQVTRPGTLLLSLSLSVPLARLHSQAPPPGSPPRHSLPGFPPSPPSLGCN